jgi:hypothetical protein
MLQDSHYCTKCRRNDQTADRLIDDCVMWGQGRRMVGGNFGILRHFVRAGLALGAYLWGRYRELIVLLIHLFTKRTRIVIWSDKRRHRKDAARTLSFRKQFRGGCFCVDDGDDISSSSIWRALSCSGKEVCPLASGGRVHLVCRKSFIVVFKTPRDSGSLKVECENFSTFVIRHRNYYAIYLEIAAILLIPIILSIQIMNV